MPASTQFVVQFRIAIRRRHRVLPRTFPSALCGLFLATAASPLFSAQTDIQAPPGSTYFASVVRLLPNGNFVVTGSGVASEQAGAVYLFDPKGRLISTLIGGSAFARVGGGGVTVLSDGNFVVCSPNWRDSGGPRVGAVTWVNGTTGLDATVSSINSLVGSTAEDAVCSGGVTALKEGRYVVASPLWDRGSVVNAGAVTWVGTPNKGSGVVSTVNSLIGRAPEDRVGGYFTPIPAIRVLSNGNFLVASPLWDNGGLANLGAVTWVNGKQGLVGDVTANNSLVGTSSSDVVGHDDVRSGITTLSNGNFVVRSRYWDNGPYVNAGAATWGDGERGIVGAVSPQNSLVGGKSEDRVGAEPVIALSNGNYVVASPWWDQGPWTEVGAVTWGDGSVGVTGLVSPANSMVGRRSLDFVGIRAIALANGNYVVSSSSWDNDEVQNVGAVTWADGSRAFAGPVTPENSLIGTRYGEGIGAPGSIALTNGNYVVLSRGAANALGVPVGAVTWGNGFTGSVGLVTSANSLFGGPAPYSIGHRGVYALANGNYVVASPFWNESTGAVTWGDGTTGTVGQITSDNSLIGSVPGDRVGMGGIVVLNNGNYVALSPEWDHSAATDAGATTWGEGATGTTTGVLSSSNSLVGIRSADQVGSGYITAYSDNHYVVYSPLWDHAGIANAGAATLLSGDGWVPTAITASNSVLGTLADEVDWSIHYDVDHKQLIVGRPAARTVSLLTLVPDPLFANGFEESTGVTPRPSF